MCLIESFKKEFLLSRSMDTYVHSPKSVQLVRSLQFSKFML